MSKQEKYFHDDCVIYPNTNGANPSNFIHEYKGVGSKIIGAQIIRNYGYICESQLRFNGNGQEFDCTLDQLILNFGNDNEFPIKGLENISDFITLPPKDSFLTALKNKPVKLYLNGTNIVGIGIQLNR